MSKKENAVKNDETIKGFDLSHFDNLASDEGEWMDVLHPATHLPLINTRGEPVRIRLVGLDSARCRQKQRSFTNRRLKMRKASLTAEQIENEKIELIATCSVDWQGFIDGGVDLPFSAATALALYKRPALRFIVDQADEFIADRADFL